MKVGRICGLCHRLCAGFVCVDFVCAFYIYFEWSLFSSSNEDKHTSKHYKNEPWLNGVFSKDNLPNKTKDGAYVINLDEYSDVGTYWISLYALNNIVTNFDNFGVEHLPKETKKNYDNKNIKTNIFKILAYDSVMCRYFCIGFFDFMFSSIYISLFGSAVLLQGIKLPPSFLQKYLSNLLQTW